MELGGTGGGGQPTAAEAAAHRRARAEARAAAARLTAEAQQLVEDAPEHSPAEAAAAVDAALGCLAEAVASEREVVHPPAQDGLLQFSAASPDDKALVEGAAAMGFVFLGRRRGRLLARILGRVREYEVVSVVRGPANRFWVATPGFSCGGADPGSTAGPRRCRSTRTGSGCRWCCRRWCRRSRPPTG